MSDKFDKFTERTRKVLTLAQEEAQRFNHNYIGTEHILLGLVREGDGVAARVLSGLGVELDKIRSSVEFIVGRGEKKVIGDIGLTPRAKKVIELAVDEAKRLNHHYIGTEHLLLGLVREGEGIAAGVLEAMGVSLAKVRRETLRVLDNSTGGMVRYNPPPSSAVNASIAEPLSSKEAWAEVVDNARYNGLTYNSWHEISKTLGELAFDEAMRLQHCTLGTEHILIALMKTNNLASRALTNLGITLEQAREQLAQVRAQGDLRAPELMSISARAGALDRYAREMARQLGHNYLGAEHFLLAMVNMRDSLAATILRNLGVTIEQVRDELMRLLDKPQS